MSFAHEDPVRVALDAAVRAPSPHNSQPWRFEVDGDRIGVFLDPDRILKVADPDGREARLACGAAVLNVRLALRAAGRTPVVHLLPRRDVPEHLATVWARGRVTPTPDDVALARAIAYRRSNRRAFTAREVPVWVRQALVRAASEEGAHLAVVGRAGQLDELGVLLREAERLQREDLAFQDELRQWTASDGARDDGVPASAAGAGPEWPFDRKPLVAVLSSYTDTRLAQLRAGQALQRVLLRATTAGVSVSFLSQPVEIPVLRAAVARLVSAPGNPQVVLRFGYGFAAPATRRRPAEAVTRYTVQG
ncbi:nitroreductase [Amycolatopsis tucumanensis]|uniref:nitroreductase n=1 Tax=Amycolatopsis tucumanensis TaxID=401106 RepID=UPI003D72D96C